MYKNKKWERERESMSEWERGCSTPFKHSVNLGNDIGSIYIEREREKRKITEE